MVNGARVSESVRLGTILMLSGGFMDAYSYLIRGNVFATAETGNIALMGINLARGNWGLAFHYLIPICSYVLGIFAAEYSRVKIGNNKHLHWTESVLCFEVLCAVFISFLGQEYNSLANCLIGFSCAMQVEAFRKVRGKAFATTMCTGNLRSGTELLFNKKYKESLHYYWIDFSFVIGAVTGTHLCKVLAERAIWFSVAMLLLAIGFIEYQKRSGEV